MAVEAMGGCGLCLAPLLRPSIVHGTRRLAMGHSLPVKYSPAAVVGITLVSEQDTWMYFSHHQHAQEAPCSVLVLAPKRSAFKEAWFRSLWEPCRTSWWSVHAGDETSSAVRWMWLTLYALFYSYASLYFTHRTTIPLTDSYLAVSTWWNPG